MSIQMPSYLSKIQRMGADQAKTAFSKLDLKIEELISSLIIFFGILNQNTLKKLNFNIKVSYDKELIRLEKTLQVYLDVIKKNSNNEQITSNIINETTAILEDERLCDHLDSMKKNTWDSTQKDILNYLLAFPMPLQNSKFRGYHSIKWIKDEIELYEGERQTVLMNLIRTLEPDPIVIEFTEEQQQLFFKHTAIKAFGIETSLGEILNKWRVEANCNIGWMQETLFFKIIIQNQKKNAELKPVEGTGLFKPYLFNEIVTILCHHPKSLLPQSKYFKDELLRLFEKSITCENTMYSQQMIMWYIDYLHQNATQTKDSFKNGLDTLNNQISSSDMECSITNSEIYNFLHALLHYFHCLHIDIDVENGKHTLFKKIFKLNYEQRTVTFLCHRPKSLLPQSDYFKKELLRLYEISIIRENTLYAQQTIMWYIDYLHQSSTQTENSYKNGLTTLNSHTSNSESEHSFTNSDIYNFLHALLHYFHCLHVGIDAENGRHTLFKEIFELNYEQRTVAFLCHHPKSLLPQSDYFKKELLKLFELSTIREKTMYAQQTIMWYADYLHQNSVSHQSEDFIIQGLITLKSKIPNSEMEYSITNSGIYNFLHALLHYFHCLHGDIDAKEGRHTLFKEIFDLDYVQRKKYDTPIKERRNMKLFHRERFKIDSSFLEFLEKHPFPRKMLGNVFLRCARSNQSGVPCPYMSPEKYVLLIECIEKFIGSTLPASIIYDILFFQMTEEKIFDVLTEFTSIRKEIIAKHLYDIALPHDLFKDLEILAASSFMEQFTHILPSNLVELNKRGTTFPWTLNNITFLLRFTTYPKASVAFSELIPTEINKEQFIFKENNIINHLRPLHPIFEFGPSWHVRWEFNQKYKNHEMVVLLTNPFHNNISCSFRVPIRIPTEDKLEVRQIFELLSSLVDGLGKEALDENETKEFKSQCLESRPIPQDSLPNLKIKSVNQSFKSKAGKKNQTSTIPIASTPDKKFDNYLEFSPLMKAPFKKLVDIKQQNKPIETFWITEIKSELFEFVNLLRSSFLQSFYFVLIPNEVQLNEPNSNINFIAPCPDGYRLLTTFSILPQENSGQISYSKVHIRMKDHIEQFQMIYNSIYNPDEKTFQKFQGEFTLHLNREGPDFNTLVNLQIEKVFKTVTFISKEDLVEEVEEDPSLLLLSESEKKILEENKAASSNEFVQFTMNLLLEDNTPYTLTINRPFFESEKDFTDFMLWQVAVICSDNRGSWLYKY